MAFKTAFAKACFILVAGACTGVPAHAQPSKPIRARLIVFNQALSPAEISEVANRTTAALYPFAQVARIDQRTWRGLPSAGVDVPSRSTQLHAAARWARAKRMHRGSPLVAIITPALLGGDSGYLAGLAEGTCRRGFVTVNTKPGRVESNTVGVVHELAHLLGASHIASPSSWMHPAAIDEAKANYQATARFLPESVAQMRRCGLR